jgi:hypothetical protein
MDEREGRPRTGSTLTVTVPRNVALDLKTVRRIQEELADRLGWPRAVDVLFRTDHDFVVDPRLSEQDGIPVRLG